MSRHRVVDYLEHMRQAATDACSFVEGMDREAFLEDRRSQQAVILSLIIMGEAATKVMEADEVFVDSHPEIPWRNM